MNKNFIFPLILVALVAAAIALVVWKGKEKKSSPSPSPAAPPSVQQPAPQIQQLAPVMVQQKLRAPLQHPMDARFLRDDVQSQRASSREQADIYNSVKQRMLQQGVVMNTPQPFDAGSAYDISMASLDPNNNDITGGLATSAITIPDRQVPSLIEIDGGSMSRIQNGELDAIVFFYMDGDQFCREVRPKLQSIAAGLPKSFVAISDAKSSPFWAQYKIEKFPTLLAFKGGVPTLYQGDWNIPTLTTFANGV